jgi:lipopolysaccharide/colanic/teichoic acid biosynthesis glycosyltransferase
MIRLFDIVFALTVLVFFLPLGILISISIVLDDPGAVFYLQERVGRFGKIFKIVKFRSMKMRQDASASLITVGMRDPRITRIGFFLRKYKLDEFPQFINVLVGDMSIVGPRPEVQKYVSLYNEQQQKVLTIRPGITDRASLEYFDENRLLGSSEDPEKTYIEEIMPAKLKINLQYVAKQSFVENIRIIAQTVKKVIS